jgi:SAM-dependent methyltransferase
MKKVKAIKKCLACQGTLVDFFCGRQDLKIGVCDLCKSRVLLDSGVSDSDMYQKNYYSGWNMKPGSHSWNLRALTTTARLKKIKTFGKVKSVLDVGCAGGYLVQAASDMGIEAWGVEVSAEAVKIARHVLGKRVLKGSLDHKFLNDKKFDLVTMFDVLEHHPRPVNFLKQAHRKISMDGFLAFTCPDADSLSRLFMGKNWSHYKAEHLMYFSRIGVKKILDKTGFKIIYQAPAVKTLSLEFITPLLKRYPVPGLSAVAGFLYSITPVFCRKIPLKLRIGERFYLAKKKRRGA